MRVLMLSKALVVGIYQRKCEVLVERAPVVLGEPLELCVCVPPRWTDERGTMWLERAHMQGYQLTVLPLRRDGDFHLHTYIGLKKVMAAFRPDLVHIDEEPYNAAAWQAQWFADGVGAKTVFFSWQNIARRYPPPFSWGERWMFRRVSAAITGTESAAAVWRAKGYGGEIAVIPQFGTDAETFHPAQMRPDRPFTIGYIGRLVEEKGVGVLLKAFARLPGDARLLIIGGGPERAALRRMARALGVTNRIKFSPQVPSTEIAAAYHKLDVLALPSLTRQRWKEQFGRVLLEAMASGVPVVGSDSGAIPDVVGDAGLIAPEGDVSAWAAAIARLRDEPGLAERLKLAGRERAIAHFSHEGVADATLRLYRQLLEW